MQRFPKRPGTMRAMHPPLPRGKWRVVAVTSKDPEEFAQEMDEKLNELVSDGWNIQGMLERNGATIITAQKPEVPREVLEALGMLAQETKRPQKTPFPVREDNTTEEIVYSYRENGVVHSLGCDSLEQAKDFMEQHLDESEGCLPISIVVMSVTSYEPADLPTLRRFFPKET